MAPIESTSVVAHGPKKPSGSGPTGFLYCPSRVPGGVSQMRDTSREGWDEYVMGALFGLTRAGMSGRAQRLGLFLLEGV